MELDRGGLRKKCVAKVVDVLNERGEQLAREWQPLLAELQPNDVALDVSDLDASPHQKVGEEPWSVVARTAPARA
jgi:hypothetical protein